MIIFVAMSRRAVLNLARATRSQVGTQATCHTTGRIAAPPKSTLKGASAPPESDEEPKQGGDGFFGVSCLSNLTCLHKTSLQPASRRGLASDVSAHSQSLFYGSKQAKEEGMIAHTSGAGGPHSKLVGRGKYVHEKITHKVIPSQRDEYLKAAERYFTLLKERGAELGGVKVRAFLLVRCADSIAHGKLGMHHWECGGIHAHPGI